MLVYNSANTKAGHLQANQGMTKPLFSLIKKIYFIKPLTEEVRFSGFCVLTCCQLAFACSSTATLLND